MPTPAPTVIKRRPRVKGTAAYSYLWKVVYTETTRQMDHSSNRRRLLLRGPYSPDWPARIERGDTGKYGLRIDPEELVRVEARDSGGIILAVKNVWTPSVAEMQRRREKARQKAKRARLAVQQQEQARRAHELAKVNRLIAEARAETARLRALSRAQMVP
jgi:hypothetical protein